MKNNELNKTIGKIFKNKRLELGYSQKQVAEKIGINTTTYRDNESGKNTMSFDTFIKLCTFFKIDPNDFVRYIK